MEPFIYEWHELIKGRRLTAKLILQAVILAVLVGFGPELVCMAMGYGLDTSIYQLRFMAAVVPIVLIISIISYRKEPTSEVTTSTLCIDGETAKITRYVMSEKEHRFFVTWDSLKITAIRIDELHRTIQINGRWRVSAYGVKKGKPGKFIDSEIRAYPQTFQFTPEAYYEAVLYLEETCPDLLSELDEKEYREAKKFIHKHYEI